MRMCPHGVELVTHEGITRRVKCNACETDFDEAQARADKRGFVEQACIAVWSTNGLTPSESVKAAVTLWDSLEEQVPR